MSTVPHNNSASSHFNDLSVVAMAGLGRIGTADVLSIFDRGLAAGLADPRVAQTQSVAMENVVVPVEGRTVDALIASFLSDPLSSYQKNRYCTRRYYDVLLKRLSRDHGSELVANINARKVLGWHQAWCGPEGKKPMAHALIGALRTIVGFGVTMLEWEECRNLKMVLSGLRFPMARPRSTVLTTDHVIAIRHLAHEQGLHSLAFAQSLQHGCTFRQRDVIGEWVPESEPVPGYVFHKGKKWSRGVIWKELDADLILRHTTSKRNKPVVIDFKLAPMIVQELRYIPQPQILAGGPMVISEETGRPWQAQEYRKVWRSIADKVGVPKNVFSMDTRAGAITEALSLGARPIAVQKTATHSNLSTTQIYARGDADDAAEVMRLRAQAHIEKLGDAA